VGSPLSRTGKKIWNKGAELSPFSSSDKSSNKRQNQKHNGQYNQTDPKGTESAKNFHNHTPSSNSNIHNYSTKEEFVKAKTAVHNMSPEKAARKAVYNSLHEAGKGFEKHSPQRTAIAQMMEDLRKGRPIDAATFSELTGKEVPAGKGVKGIKGLEKVRRQNLRLD
jgi:hypothetical protein